MTKTFFSRGYTLVELVVAVGLFALVMTLASGAYFLMVNTNRQAQASTAGLDSIAFAMEKMVRTIRTGTEYACNGVASDCVSGGTRFSFTSAGGETIEYRQSGTTPDGIEERINGGSARTLTDPTVDITHLRFYLSGRSTSDTVQPRVTIVVGGTVSIGAGRTESFLIETGATMRGTDI